MGKRVLNKAMSCPASPNVKKVYRLVVLGSVRCGKTSIINRFLKNEFSDAYMPTVEDFHRRIYRIQGELYQLDIVDTSGNDPFPAARRLSLSTGDLFILVCSVERPCSTAQVVNYFQQINECKQYFPPLVIAVNKIDLPPNQHILKVQGDEGLLKLFKQGRNPPAIHMCSAKDGTNIKSLFADLLSQGNLPQEINLAHEKDESSRPSRPRTITKQQSQDQQSSSPKNSPLSRLKIGSRRDNPATVFDDPEARRPSLRTDLLIMKARKRGGKAVLNGARTRTDSQSPNRFTFANRQWFSASADDDHFPTVKSTQTSSTTNQKCSIM